MKSPALSPSTSAAVLLILFTAAQDNRAPTFTLNLAVALPNCVEPLNADYQSPALTKRVQLWITVPSPLLRLSPKERKTPTEKAHLLQTSDKA